MSPSICRTKVRLFSRNTVLLSFAIAGLFAGGPAQAREGDLPPALQLAVDACARRQGTTPQARIASCSKAMESASLIALDRAEAYLNRGEAYMATGDYRSALADYNESERLRALYEVGV